VQSHKMPFHSPWHTSTDHHEHLCMETRVVTCCRLLRLGMRSSHVKQLYRGLSRRQSWPIYRHYCNQYPSQILNHHPPNKSDNLLAIVASMSAYEHTHLVLMMAHYPFKDEAYVFYIRTQCVPRCKHSPRRL
jgi:hypothetical protein